MSRLKQDVASHLHKARESALLAVETYNRPSTTFRSGGYIVLMVIAWTALFHAIFLHRRIKPFYRRKSNRHYFERIDGDLKAWELSTCVSEFWKDFTSPSRLNIEFFIKLRNKIEHRSMPGLDLDIFGECQALLFNFEELLVEEFGHKYALNESLTLALQFSCSRSQQQEKAIRKLHTGLARDIREYVDAFRSSLTTEQMADLHFSYKVFLIPKPANRQSGSDLAVEFVKYNRDDPNDMNRVDRAIALLKPTAADRISIHAESSNDSSAIPFRLVNDDSATAVRALNPDVTHPYRQKDLLPRLINRIGREVKVTTHDLQCTRELFEVVGNANYYYKSRFGTGQYSRAYLEWLVAKFQADVNFFANNRASLAEKKQKARDPAQLNLGDALDLSHARDAAHIHRKLIQVA